MKFLLPLFSQVTPPAAVEGLSFGWLFFKMILAMSFVIALAVFLIRVLLPRLYKVGGPSGGSIKIIERFGLEPRKVLYIVEVNNKKILLGTSDHQISKLMDLETKKESL